MDESKKAKVWASVAMQQLNTVVDQKKKNQIKGLLCWLLYISNMWLPLKPVHEIQWAGFQLYPLLFKHFILL